MNRGVAVMSLVAIVSGGPLSPDTRAEAGDVRIGIAIATPGPPPVVVVEPWPVYAPPPPVVYAPGPGVHHGYRHGHRGKAGRWKHVYELGRASPHVDIPPGHYPPPGECRLWLPDRPPGHQPPPMRC